MKFPEWLQMAGRSAVQSAGFVALIVCGIDVVGIVLTKQVIPEIIYETVLQVISFGWFGFWAISFDRKLKKNGNKGAKP